MLPEAPPARGPESLGASGRRTVGVRGPGRKAGGLGAGGRSGRTEEVLCGAFCGAVVG